MVLAHGDNSTHPRNLNFPIYFKIHMLKYLYQQPNLKFSHNVHCICMSFKLVKTVREVFYQNNSYE